MPVTFDFPEQEGIVNTTTTAFQGNPVVVALAGGGYVIVWNDESGLGGDTSGSSVRAQLYEDDGTPIGGEFLINQATDGNQYLSSATALAGGGFAVAWTTFASGGTSPDAKARVFGADGTPGGGEFMVPTAIAGYQEGAIVAGLDGGGFVAVWTDYGPDGTTFDGTLRGQLFLADGTPSGAVFDIANQTSGSQFLPAIAVLDDGGFVVSWTGPGIQARIFANDGSPQGAQFAVSEASSFQSNATVAALDGGGFVIGWWDFSGPAGTYDIRARLYDSDAHALAGSFILSETTAGAQQSPKILSWDGGGFIVAWSDDSEVSGDTDNAIMARTFSNTGVATSGDQRLNSLLPGDQVAPSLAVLADGTMVGAWDVRPSNSIGVYDGSGAAVFARRFTVSADSTGSGTVFGTIGDDHLTAAAGGAILSGYGGADTLTGGVGNDTIDGGNGDDQIHGGDGSDDLYGGNGDDAIDGGAGADFLQGEDGNDTLTGVGDGGAAQEWMSGGPGDDTFTVSGGVFNIFGDDYGDGTGQPGNGNDHIVVTNGGGSWLNGQGGDDIIEASGTGMIVVSGGTGADAITLSGFSSGNVDPGTGNDIVHLAAGNFTVTLANGQIGAGRDSLVMTSTGSGFITIIGFAAGTQGDLLDLSVYGSDPFGTGTLVMGANGPDTYIDHPASGMRYVLQNVRGANLSADNLGVPNPGYAPVGLTLNDAFADQPDIAWNGELVGADGNDTIRGFGGNDRLYSGAGDDLLEGGAGHDVFLFGASMTSADSVDGGAGIDQIAIQGNYSGGSALTLGSGVIAFESIAILAGNDIRFGDPGTNFYDYDITTLDVNVAAGGKVIVDANRLRPGEDFTFNGSAETDGGFFIWGGGGTDTLTGGSQTDIFYFGENLQFGASDTVNGGAGTDQLGLRGNYTIVFGAGQVIGIENIGLVSAQDTRFGGLGSTFNYNLTMNDANLASGVLMTVDGAALRNGETLTFNGSAETDGLFRIFGGQGNDVIATGSGNDIIQGGRGADDMTGGGGADTFRYITTLDSTGASMDEILDFQSGTDKIDLSRIDANTYVDGDQAFHFIGSSQFFGTGTGGGGPLFAGALRAYESGGTWFVEGDTNGDAVADFVIQVSLVPGPMATLQASDFIL